MGKLISKSRDAEADIRAGLVAEVAITEAQLLLTRMSPARTANNMILPFRRTYGINQRFDTTRHGVTIINPLGDVATEVVNTRCIRRKTTTR